MSKKNSRAMENFKLGASTLINNNSCIEMGRTRPWYAAIIAGLLSVIIAVLPIMISQFSVEGGELLDAPTYDIDNALIHFQEDLNTKNVSMEINKETKEMSVVNWNNMVNKTENNSYVLKSIDDTTYFEVFWTEETGDALTDYSTKVLNDSEGNAITHSYLFLYKTGFRFSKYVSSSSTSSVYGQYDRLTKNFDLKDFAKEDSYGNPYEVNYLTADKDTYGEYFDASIAAWKTFLTDCYHTYKVSSAWSWTGIMCGVYAAFLFLMGLMLFLMTRGKNNPYRIYTFWETQKIAYWAAPASAIVGMIFSFIMSSMAMMAFIFVCGIRVMWLSMKNLRPQA